MSHVDDGTLHAYLDGESTAVEREHLEAHLAGCAACRARLEEERALIERAGRLLGLAAPPERAAPPFHELRRPRRGGGGYRMPLAWAATIALAVGIGWYSRGMFRAPRQEQQQVEKVAVDAPPRAPAASAELRAPAPSAPGNRAEPRRDQPSAPSSDAVAIRGGAAQETPRAERPESITVVAASGAVSRLETESAQPALRDAVAPVQAPPAPIVIVDGRPRYDETAIHRMSTSWPLIEPKRARDLLGEEPAVIPGYAVRALRSNPAARSEIVVEQMVDTGLVLLFERRSDVAGFAAPPPTPRLAQGQAAGKANERQVSERLARYIRSLRVEIAGPLSADSLSALLGLIR